MDDGMPVYIPALVMLGWIKRTDYRTLIKTADANTLIRIPPMFRILSGK